MSFAGLLRREPRALAFGVLHTLGATIGQTFVIALFLPGIKESFALRDGSISVMFTGTTLASAALLWQIGPRLDRNDLLRYSLACGAFLAAACALIAASRDIVLLVFGLFCLRLAGNGLLTHVALTATARCFTADRGRALSVVLLGSSVGEAALPAPVVAMLTAWGWRPTLVCAGCLGLLLVLAAGCGVRTHSGFRHPRPDLPYRAGGPSRHIGEAPAAPLRRYWVLTAPLFVAMPASITGAVFHQALIAEWKGVTLQWFAVSFIAFAISRVATSIGIGPIVDRIGSDRLFTVHLLPLALGTSALIVADGTSIVPLYWFCAGVTSGMGTVLQTTVIAERVRRERLAHARSTLAAITIVASAAGPSLYGLAFAAGAGTTAVLWCSVAVLLGATVLGRVATRSLERARERRRSAGVT